MNIDREGERERCCRCCRCCKNMFHIRVYMCTYVYIYICTYTIYLTWLYVPHVYIFTRTSKQLDVYMYTYMYVHV